MANKIPVLIIGAGPAGLTIAIELLRRGIPCRLVERKSAPLLTSNALVVQPRTLEIWHEEQVLEEALAKGVRIHAMSMYLGDKRLSRIEFAQLQTQFPFQLALPQSESERLLARRVAALGGTVERSTEAIELKPNNRNVTVRVQRQTTEIEEIEAGWVVGCDGGQSFVRSSSGLAFMGSDLSERFIMADLPLHSPLPNDESHAFFSNRGACGIIPLNGYSRIIFEVTREKDIADEKTPRLEHFEALAKERCPIRLEFGAPLWTSSLWTHQRISSAYRAQRVFLAGDAAHVHSPVGGQGMNTSIQDAYNLGWKLALVVREKAQPALLDSYERERRPVAEQVLKRSTVMTRMVAIRNPLARRLRNILLRVLFGTRKGALRQSQNVSNCAVSYRNSPLTPQPTASPDPFSAKLRPGDRAPFPTMFNSSGFTVLLSAPSSEEQDAQSIEQALEAFRRDFKDMTISMITDNPFLRSRWPDIGIISDPGGVLRGSFGMSGLSLCLLRPDKHIALGSQPPDFDQLRKYLTDNVHLQEGS